MFSKQLVSMKKQLMKWGYPRCLIEKMKPGRILKCYQNEKVFQEYQSIKEREYYLAQLLKLHGSCSPSKPSCKIASPIYYQCLQPGKASPPSRPAKEGITSRL